MKIILTHKIVNFTRLFLLYVPMFLHNMVFESIPMFFNDLMTKYPLPFLLCPDSLINQSDTINNTNKKSNPLLNHLE